MLLLDADADDDADGDGDVDGDGDEAVPVGGEIAGGGGTSGSCEAPPPVKSNCTSTVLQ